MKSTIKENRAKELAAKTAAEEAAKKEALLKDIKPLDIVGTLKQIEEEATDASVVCDKDGNPIAICGGKYICEVYHGEVIAAATQEALDAIKGRIDKGIHGDGLLHKNVTINGKTIPVVGATEEELDADALSIEKYMRSHPAEPKRDHTVATMLHEAGYKAENLEQLKVYSKDYLLVYEGPSKEKNYVMDLEGKTIVDLADIKDKLSRETVKIWLTERLEKKVKPVEKAASQPYQAPRPESNRRPRPARKTYKDILAECACTDVRNVCRVIVHRSYGLEDAIKHVLVSQDWSTTSYNGNERCYCLNHVSALGVKNQPAEVINTVINPTIAFLVEKLEDESPIEANNLNDLVKKITDVVYEGLAKEPYFGMNPSTGGALAKLIAQEIIRMAQGQ